MNFSRDRLKTRRLRLPAERPARIREDAAVVAEHRADAVRVAQLLGESRAAEKARRLNELDGKTRVMR